MLAAGDNNISIDDYHDSSKTPGISATGLIHFARSPAHYKEYRDTPPKETPAMTLGRAVHTAILEPTKFYLEYIALDDTDICARIGGAKPRATNDYKRWYADWAVANANKTVISWDDYRTAQRIAERVRAHPTVSAILTVPGEVEESLLWEDSETGVRMKARPDFRQHDGMIVDFKTTQDARPDAFARQIFSMGYFLQAAVYREAVRAIYGENHVPFVFVAIESNSPHAIGVYELDETAREVGDMEMRRCLDLYARCLEADFWPAYPGGMQSISLPNWAIERAVS